MDERKQIAALPGWKRFRHFTKLGEEMIPLSQADIAELKRRSNANQLFSSLILLGFKRPEDVPFHHNMDRSWFVYPNDEMEDTSAPNSSSSTEAFAHLHAAMQRKGVVGIGELLTRKNGTSQLVAIHPISPAHRDDDEELERIHHKMPSGMVIVKLPFEEEVRSLDPDPAAERQADERLENSNNVGGSRIKKENDDDDENTTSNASEMLEIPQALTDAVQALVTKNTFPEGIVWEEDFKNAALEYFWDNLEYGALGEQLPVNKKYLVAEAIEGQDLTEVLGTYADAVRDALPEEPEKIKPTRKRRLIPTEVDDTGINWGRLLQDDNLNSARVVDLKKKLGSMGLQKTGRKSELAQRLADAMNNED